MLIQSHEMVNQREGVTVVTPGSRSRYEIYVPAPLFIGQVAFYGVFDFLRQTIESCLVAPKDKRIRLTEKKPRPECAYRGL